MYIKKNGYPEAAGLPVEISDQYYRGLRNDLRDKYEYKHEKEKPIVIPNGEGEMKIIQDYLSSRSVGYTSGWNSLTNEGEISFWADGGPRHFTFKDGKWHDSDPKILENVRKLMKLD